MNMRLNPNELQSLIDQIVSALSPTLQKRVEAAAKVSEEDVLYYLTVEEVAKRLKCDPKTVWKRIHEDKLRAANVGNFKRPQYRVSETDFSAFYHAHRTGR